MMSDGKGNHIIRTRFAPSPSGALHVGGARTAIYNWAYARARGGKFILRIEDTDQKRSSDAACKALMRDLRRLGIEWDEGPEYENCGGGDAGPYFCSQRLEIYHTHIQRLLDEGKAYRAFETPEEIKTARRKAREEKRNYRYDRAAPKLDKATVQRFLDENRPHVVRFKTPAEEIVFCDEVRGEVRVSPDELDDFVIRKADGFPTYHFAVVVDDELMGVTHVIRAQEHLSNTPRHILLQEALGFRHPVYAHLSVIMNPDGSKMSKRDKAKAIRTSFGPNWKTLSNEKQRHFVHRLAHLDRLVRKDLPFALRRHRDLFQDVDHLFGSGEFQAFFEEVTQFMDKESDEAAIAELIGDVLGIGLPEIDLQDFRRNGYLPEVLVNYLALLGWNPGDDLEKFDQEFLIEHFDFDRVIKSPARFDRDKLLAFNLDALQAMSVDEFVDRLGEHAAQFHPEFIRVLGDRFDLFARANHARSKTLDDPFRSDRFFIVADDSIEYESSKGVRKALEGSDPNGYTHLEAMRPRLDALAEWTPATIETAVRQYADEHAAGKLGKVAQPLRIAVTGGTVSPAIFDTLAILGKDSTLRRIDRCLSRRAEQCTP